MSELGVQKLGDVCDITMGQAPPGSTYNLLGDGLPQSRELATLVIARR